MLDEQDRHVARQAGDDTRTAPRFRPPECPPRARRAAGCAAASPAPARSRAAAACRRRDRASARSRSAVEPQRLEQRAALRRRPRLCRATVRLHTAARPWRSQIASTTDSSTVSPGNSVLIWNVRVIPRLTRSCCGSAVMFSSPRNTSPAVGGSTPVSRLMNVVLPAPLGPISAWRAPGGSEADVGVRVERAERLRQALGAQCGASCRYRFAQPLAQRVESAEDAAAREQHDERPASNPSQNCQ